MINEKARTLTFKVQSFRKVPNPYLNSEEGERNAATYIAMCDVKNIPDSIPMETNPREQKLTTTVAKKIKRSLLNEDDFKNNFYLLNRGILLSAKEVTFNNYSNEITVVFDDFEVHGNVDGGHTYKTIIENRNMIDEGQQYVKIEILTGVEDIFQSLAAARNTSVQVQDKSIAELEDRFEIIKSTLARESYMDRVFFKENEKGDIDVADLLAILNLFNIDRYRGMDTFPINSYSSKKRCIDLYINDHKEYGESLKNPYVKMKPIMVDIFKLYNEIEKNMNSLYRQKNPNGRFGSIKGITVPKAGQEFKSKFMNDSIEVMSPNGFIYPILGSFRALVEEKNGAYTWKNNPFSILNDVGPDLVDSTVSMSRSLGNNPQSVGKDSNIWKTLYMTVAFELMS